MSAKTTSLWFRATETLLLLLALLLPLAFCLRGYDSAMIKTTLFQAGVLAMVFSWLFKNLERGRWQVPVQASPLLLPAAALLAWSALRFLTAPHKLAALPGFLQQALYLAVYAIVLLEFGGFRNASRFARWVLAAAWACGLYGLAQRLGLDPFLWREAFEGRVFSTFANPDLYGLFLALCLPLALTRLLDPERALHAKAADMALLGFLGLNLVWTASVDGLMALTAIGLVCAFVLPSFVPSQSALRAAGLSLIMTLGVLAAALAFNRAALEKSLADGAEFRQYAWEGAVAMISERPLTGHGPGSFFVHFPRFRPAGLARLEGRDKALTEHAESELLELTAELGLVGAALWIWLFVALLAAAWRARRLFLQQVALGESCYLAGFFAAVLGFLVAAQFGLGTHFLAPGWLLWPAAGLLGGLTLLAPRERAVRVLPLALSEENRRRLYAPAMLSFAILAAFPAQWFRSDLELNVAVRRGREGNREEALAHFAKVRAGGHAYLAAQYFQGNLYLDTDRPEQALERYARLESLAPDYGLLHYRKGLAYARIGDWKSAVASHERARSRDPLHVDNQVRLSISAREAGDYDRARQAAYAAIALEPRESSHLLVLSEIYLKQRRVADARRLEREAARLRSSKPARRGDG